MQTIENNQRRPVLIAGTFALFSATSHRNRTLNRWRDAQTQWSPKRALQRRILIIHNAPVDITVDKETPPGGEKAQQNQRFKYHRGALNSYRTVNKQLIAPATLQHFALASANCSVSLMLNMHRSGAGCSLSVTSIGICLSSQQRAFHAPAPFWQRWSPAPLTRPDCGTIVTQTFGMLAAHEPGVFPGNS
jgi:hypothetical protein